MHNFQYFSPHIGMPVIVLEAKNISKGSSNHS